MSKTIIASDPGDLRRWMVEYITSVLDLPVEDLSTSATFDALGVDSVEAVVMAGVMEEHFGVEIDPMLFFHNPSIDAFVAAHTGSPDDAGVPFVSLVVVSYRMGRELPRTILSLSPGYQRGCAEGEYEIIVVDNGSPEPPVAADFAHLAGNVRVLQCTRPTQSPALAVNEGLAAARGELIGVWIDGARLASPGLVAACRTAAQLHPRAVTATINYQLGPQLQYRAEQKGYDQSEEDRLLATIAWPSDGYRLFDIATGELRAGLRGPMLESNALFMRRVLWDELGGYDEQFVEPGGGFVNPDTFIRAVELPDAQLIRIAGEGTFHQIHGGVSTSTTRGLTSALRVGGRAYQRRRGRPLALVRTTGWIFDAREGRLVEREAG